MLTVKEAIHSVAASHPETCGCRICLAAGGDEDASADVFAAVLLGVPLVESHSDERKPTDG